MLAIAVAIRLSDNGPALFTQTRVGKDGQPFKIYKFRTMVVDAEARLAELREQNEFDGVLFKIRADPRITAIGARLRKWSLDELPQLINVVARRDVAGRPAAGAAGGGGEVRRSRPAPARRQAGPDRYVAGERPVRTCPGTSRCGSTCATSRTGRSRSTCRSCGRRSR